MKKYKIHKTPVKSIKQLDNFDDEYVYDIVMKNKDRQWFFGNDILVHNSTYFKTGADNIDDATKIGDYVGQKVNESFPQFMKDNFFCNDDYNHYINTDREIIGSSGIFLKKKLYIIHVTNNEGQKCDKIKAMGISLKKSTLPKEYQRKLSEYVARLLKHDDWNKISQDIVEYKTELSKIDNILRIGLPKGVKKVEFYTQDYHSELKASEDKEAGRDYKRHPTNKSHLSKEAYRSRLPGHVAASIHWNICLDKYNDRDSIKITSGTKIKVYYLKQQFYHRFKSIAIPTDTSEVPDWFIKEYKDHIDIDAQLDRLIDKSLEGILEAIDKVPPSAQGLLVDDLLGF